MRGVAQHISSYLLMTSRVMYHHHGEREGQASPDVVWCSSSGAVLLTAAQARWRSLCRRIAIGTVSCQMPRLVALVADHCTTEKLQSCILMQELVHRSEYLYVYCYRAIRR